MLDLREQLEHCFQGRVCLIGLGNMDSGDDGFGVLLAEALARSRTRAGEFEVILAGANPERFLGQVAAGLFDHVIFLDAVDFGGAPGETVFLSADEISARFPQISTHKVSLGLLARCVEANSWTKASLLGVQPQSLRSAKGLSRVVQTSLELLRELLQDIFSTGGKGCEHGAQCARAGKARELLA